MLVLVPTREDVLAIRSIEDAFDLSVPKPLPWEVALIRTALAGGLLQRTVHSIDAAEDDFIPDAVVERVIATGKAASKDTDPHGARQIGINFEGRARGRRTVRVKVSWESGYYIPTVHAV